MYAFAPLMIGIMSPDPAVVALGASVLRIEAFAEPMFACIFGAMLLGEDIFKWQYPVAFILISGGILLANKRKKEK